MSSPPKERGLAWLGAWVFVGITIYGLMAGITTAMWKSRMSEEQVKLSNHSLAGAFWPLMLPAYVGVTIWENTTDDT